MGCWIFPGLVTLSLGRTVRLRRLFVQYHCRTLDEPRLTVGSLSIRVLHRMSRDRGERRTDPVGFRADSLQPSPYRFDA